MGLLRLQGPRLVLQPKETRPIRPSAQSKANFSPLTSPFIRRAQCQHGHLVRMRCDTLGENALKMEMSVRVLTVAASEISSPFTRLHRNENPEEFGLCLIQCKPMDA